MASPGVLCHVPSQGYRLTAPEGQELPRHFAQTAGHVLTWVSLRAGTDEKIQSAEQTARIPEEVRRPGKGTALGFWLGVALRGP